MVALAFLAVTRVRLPDSRDGLGAVVVTAGVLVALLVVGLRRLLARLVRRPPVDPMFTVAWLAWRRVTTPPLDAPTTSNNVEKCDCGTKGLSSVSRTHPDANRGIAMGGRRFVRATDPPKWRRMSRFARGHHEPSSMTDHPAVVDSFGYVGPRLSRSIAVSGPARGAT
jgi:hypothetical protein